MAKFAPANDEDFKTISLHLLLMMRAAPKKSTRTGHIIKRPMVGDTGALRD